MSDGLKMAGVVGIEPTSTVLETAVLPLNYTPKVTELFYSLVCTLSSVMLNLLRLFINYIRRLAMRLAVIGTGNMGRALMGGFIRGGIIAPQDIYCFDVVSSALEACREEFGINVASSGSEAVSCCDYVLLAVKPQHFDATCAGLASSFKDGAVILSIAAAVTCDRIRGLIGDRKFVRIMPNTPAQVGCGVSAVCPVGLTEEETAFVSKLLGTCGEVIICDEKTLDAIGCVSGTGPAYVMLFIEALADAAVSLGIKRDDALKIAAGTVMGSGKLCLDTGKNPAVLKDMVCSPGGTTIAGVMALEENGFRNAAIKSVLAAYNKTLEMQNKK